MAAADRNLEGKDRTQGPRLVPSAAPGPDRPRVGARDGADAGPHRPIACRRPAKGRRLRPTLRAAPIYSLCVQLVTMYHPFAIGDGGFDARLCPSPRAPPAPAVRACLDLLRPFRAHP